MKTLEQKLKEISPERRKKIRARTRELVAREMSLQELRHAVMYWNVRRLAVVRTIGQILALLVQVATFLVVLIRYPAPK
jgi:hypothetical protein